MSGVKDSYVKIRQSELDRIRNSCRRVDNIDTNVKRQMSNMSEQLRQAVQQQIATVERRHDNIEQRLTGLSDGMRRIEHNVNSRLQQQANEFTRGMQELGKEMARQQKEYRTLIREQEQRFSSALEEQRKALDQRISSIQREIEQKEMSQRQQAEQWLSDVSGLLDIIGSEYRHEKFRPGALEKLKAELSLCKGNIESGNYQAAIASAQQSYLRGSELRLELERLEMEWEAHLQAARRSAAEALAECNAQTAARLAFDTEAGSEELAVEVDYWTEGALSAMKKEIEQEIRRLETPEALSLEELDQSIEKSADWCKRSMKLVEQARESLIASQVRNNIAQAIEMSLIDANWQVTDSAYEGEDFRRSLHVKLRNLQGDEIVTVIMPETLGEKTIGNRLSINFFDRSTNDEAFRQERLRAIMGALEQDGLECSAPTCAPGTENGRNVNEEMLDFEKVRRLYRDAR